MPCHAPLKLDSFSNIFSSFTQAMFLKNQLTRVVFFFNQAFLANYARDWNRTWDPETEQKKNYPLSTPAGILRKLKGLCFTGTSFVSCKIVNAGKLQKITVTMNSFRRENLRKIRVF